jgi:hypothetical protein
MIGPKYLVYIPGGVPRDDAKIRAFAGAAGLSLYDAKIQLGAPGPRKVGAFVKEEEAQMQALALRQAGIMAFVIEKDRFSRAPKIFRGLKAVEDPTGLVFTIETAPAPGELNAQCFELPQPKGVVRAVVLGLYTQTTTHTAAGARGRFDRGTASRSEVQQPFVHLYSEDPHTILEITGTRFEFEWLKRLATLSGSERYQKLAEMLATFYGAKLDTTLFRMPGEVAAITAILNVDMSRGLASAGAATSSASSDDSPVAMAASRIIVYSLVFGV